MFNENTKAIYLRIADRIADEIIEGVYDEDTRMPSVREYAAAMEVNANTVMRTYDYLSSREVIYNRRGIGFFVSQGARELIRKARRDELLGGGLNLLFRHLKMADITPEMLNDLYIKYLNSSK